jgi:GH35 family endo-1,4-beta-xylanase
MNKKLSRRDFLKLAGATSAGLALSACGVKATETPTATLVHPTNTAIPTLTPVPTSTPNFENLNNVINEQIGKIVRAYQLPESQKKILANSIETIEIEGKHFWYISSSLLGRQNKNLVELFGDIPVAIQRDFEKWGSPYIKEVSKIPIGAQFSQQDNGSAEIIGSHFDFGIIDSLWGVTAFGVGSTGEKRSIFDFITIKDDNSIVLDTSKCTWEHYEDYQTREAIKYLKKDEKGVDKAKRNRRLLPVALIYPGKYSEPLPKDFDKLTKEQAISFIQQYIKAYINRYKDLFFAYVGVTEFGMSNDDLLKKIGTEYIDVVYQAIKDADPTAVLILEHTNNHVPKAMVGDIDVTKTTRETAQRLKEKGLIDYIASECHIDLFPDSPHNETYDEILQTFRSYPVPAYPSSIDINVTPYKNNPDKFFIQAKKIQTLLQASLDAGAPFISFWGNFPDELSWIETMIGEPDADATPWATGWIEKPMYFEILRTLFRNYAKIGVGS